MMEAKILADSQGLEAEDLRARQAYAASLLKKINLKLVSNETRRA